MWMIVAILLVGSIAATLAMGVWFISVPLALLLISLPLMAAMGRRVTGARQVDEFRGQADQERGDAPPGGRDHATLYEPDAQDKPPAAF